MANAFDTTPAPPDRTSPIVFAVMLGVSLLALVAGGFAVREWARTSHSLPEVIEATKKIVGELQTVGVPARGDARFLSEENAETPAMLEKLRDTLTADPIVAVSGPQTCFIQPSASPAISCTQAIETLDSSGTLTFSWLKADSGAWKIKTIDSELTLRIEFPSAAGATNEAIKIDRAAREEQTAAFLDEVFDNGLPLADSKYFNGAAVPADRLQAYRAQLSKDPIRFFFGAPACLGQAPAITCMQEIQTEESIGTIEIAWMRVAADDWRIFKVELKLEPTEPSASKPD